MMTYLKSLLTLAKKHKYITIVCVIATCFLLLISFGSRSKNPANNKISPTPTTYLSQSNNLTGKTANLSPLQRTAIGQLIPTDLDKRGDFIRKVDLGNGKAAYEFKSPLPQRPNKIITINNVAIFEQMITPSDTKAPGFAFYTSFKKRYGEPDKVFQNTQAFSTIVYADKGFALIVNTNTDEVYEIHTFVPTTPYDYFTNYGDAVDLYDRDHVEQ